jgi:hypothetical protein
LCQANGGLNGERGISPQEVIDKYDGIIRKSLILIITLELRLRYMIQLKIFFKIV